MIWNMRVLVLNYWMKSQSYLNIQVKNLNTWPYAPEYKVSVDMDCLTVPTESAAVVYNTLEEASKAIEAFIGCLDGATGTGPLVNYSFIFVPSSDPLMAPNYFK